MKDIFEVFKEAISDVENPIVFEFGGCDGYHTNIMAKILTEKNKEFKYFVFEPVKELAERIRNLLSWCPMVEVIEMAISDKIGETKLYQSDSKYYGSSSIIKPKRVYDFWQDMTFTETSCHSISFDDFVNMKNLQGKTIDFIWSDIQGAERELLVGGKSTMKNVRYFFTEFMDCEIYENQIYNLEELQELIPDFEIIEKYEEDILFKNKNL